MSVAPPSPGRRSGPRGWLLIIGGALAVIVAIVVVLVVGGGGGSGSTQTVAPVPLPHPGQGPESMFTPGSDILPPTTAATVAALKGLGVDTVHIYLHWADVAPDPHSRRRPDFDATDPAAYPASGWAPFDVIVRDLKAAGLGLDLALIPPPPAWAASTGAPDPATQPEWKPSAAEFGQFVTAVGVRYSGHYIPPGATRPLPRVDFWSIWNEPNLGTQLAPEAIDHSQVEVAPHYYRAIVDAAWSALHATGHGHDTILIGEIAPAGVSSGVGNFNNMPPLRFLRALYCVGSDYEPLRGAAATIRDCPATAAGSARFAAENPGLFHATGFADHPYPQGLPPNEPTPDEPDYAELATIGKLEATLDRLQRVYGSTTKFPIWSTEFGYQTNPPDIEAGTVTPTEAAYYLNWSEYLTWLDPRQRSYDQYLLVDPYEDLFDTGLLTYAGVPKPGFYAYRMPLYLPYTSTRNEHALAVWGDVRPAPDAARATHRIQRVAIEFRASSARAYRTIEQVTLTNRHGYFDVPVRFPGSGDVRLAWSPPHQPAIFSRTVAVTLR